MQFSKLNACAVGRILAGVLWFLNFGNGRNRMEPAGKPPQGGAQNSRIWTGRTEWADLCRESFSENGCTNLSFVTMAEIVSLKPSPRRNDFPV